MCLCYSIAGHYSVCVCHERLPFWTGNDLIKKLTLKYSVYSVCRTLCIGKKRRKENNRRGSDHSDSSEQFSHKRYTVLTNTKYMPTDTEVKW